MIDTEEGQFRLRALRRRAPPLGIGVAVLLWVGASGFGDTPDTRDTNQQVVEYFLSRRNDIFVAVVLVGLGLLGFVVVACQLAERVTHSEGTLGRVVQSTAVVSVAFMAPLLLVPATLSYVVSAEAPAMAKGLFELTLVSMVIAAVPLAVLASTTAVAWRRAGTGQGWFTVMSAIVALGFTVGACSFAARGFFSPDVQQQAVLTLMVVWVGGAAIALRRTRAVD
jgi:hypothetical protein